MANITRLTGKGNRKAGDQYRATSGATVIDAAFVGKRGGHDLWTIDGPEFGHTGSLSDLADAREAERVAALESATRTIHTRESWLIAAIDTLRPRFAEIGMPIPDRLHVSVGFGGNSRAESKGVLGTCWARRASADDVNHLFISPELADTARVLDVLLHELIHAADDCASGHKGAFAEAATRLGLEGKMTATTASITLAAEMVCLAESLGEYPHGALTAFATLAPRGTPEPKGEAPISSGPRKQGTRMLKVVCPLCGYTVRTTAKWLTVGYPACPCGPTMQAG